ncbi:restriction endonuclease subunit S [Emcibacteraceae bacterium]|nr:restriction endonuclease subunit S [Emcibacteraceae bacterium]
MISQWKLVTIGDFLSHRKGFAFKSTQYTTEGRKIARVSNFTQRSIDTDGCNYIDEKEATQFSNYILNAGDVVIATVGSWPTNPASVVGRAIRVPDEANGLLLNQNAVRLRSNEHLNQIFLYYLLSADHYQNFIVSTAQGSASQASIKLRDIFSYQALIPPLSEQEAIVSVVGTLDDKIENNRRMNETLEEMARAIFKSWFVDFDPVHAKAAGNAPAHMDADTAALFPSSLGDDGLPVGWKEVPADAISTITIGKTPPRKEHHWFSNTSEDMKWASIRDMGECGTYIFQTGETLTKQAIEKFNVRVVPKNTVILSFKLTVGRVALTDEEMATNEAIAHFGEADTVYGEVQPEYLYAYLKGFNFDKLGSTSSIATAVNSKIIKAMPVMLADSSCRSAFQKLASPLFEKIRLNLRESQTLTELRDTLLPKLMSGEIRVKDAERELEAAV